MPGHPEDDLGDPESVARSICLRLLTDRPRSRAELAAALRKRDVPDDAATAVLERFDEVGLIDDAAFAASWVSSRHRGRGLGRRALAQELARKGIEKETAQTALDQVDDEAEEATARALVHKRMRSQHRLAPEVAARRLVGMLARKGYPPALAGRVVREALAGRDDDDPGSDLHARLDELR